jgi:hypothetical protein
MSWPPRGRSRIGSAVLASFALLAPAALAQSNDLPTAYAPSWANAVPKRVIRLEYDVHDNTIENGERLRQTIEALVPGDRLEVGAGTWTTKKFFNVSLQGTATDPIWIVAVPGTRPVLTRPDTVTNVMNIGMPNDPPARYLALRGFELTGGSYGLRLGSCTELWIDDNEIHHVKEAGLTANSRNTSYLWITRNEIHHTNGIGEGMYLGANNGNFVMHSSVIAQNWVHDTKGWQGDGIEVKQGSWGNLIADNVVHDTRYPCLLVYGTDGMPPNVVERNLLFRSLDNVLQVQGEAIVRNNLMFEGKNGFHSHDHQGQTRDLVFVNNTIINTRRGANLTSWANRPGMVFANNAVYSETMEAVVFGGLDATGVTVVGNVRYGPVFGPKSGFVDGVGLSDFHDAAWDGSRRRAQPIPTSRLLGAGSAALTPADDLNRMTREDATIAGALGEDSFGRHYGAGLPGLGGVVPRIGVSSARDVGNLAFALEVTDARPFENALLAVGLRPTEDPTAGGIAWNDALFLFGATTDAAGYAQVGIPVQNDPNLVGVAFYAQWGVQDRSAFGNWSLSDGLRLIVQ